jgi:hypothetical protein
MDAFFRGDLGTTPTDFRTVLLTLLLAFILGQIIAWVYQKTCRGQELVPSFVTSLILMPVLIALVMMVLSNSLVAAFGLMGVLAIVRFRNNLRDTQDTSYVLAVIVLGMACGMQKFTTALVGGLVVAGLMLYLSYTTAASRRAYDVVVKVQWSQLPGELTPLRELLDRHALRADGLKTRFDPTAKGADVSYRLLLRDPHGLDRLLHELAALPGVSRVTSFEADSADKT